MRKPDFCLCENKGADQLRGNREADQRLCFRYSDSTISLLSKFQASYHFLRLHRPVYVGPGRKPRRPVFSRHGSFSTDKYRENSDHSVATWPKKSLKGQIWTLQNGKFAEGHLAYLKP